MTSIFRTVLLPAVLGIALAGCANPVNERTADRYHKAGLAAEARGDYAAAREAYHRDLVNTRLGGLGPGAEARALYEWARMSGMVGQRQEADAGFSRTIELINEADGGADALRAPALAEFARFLHDTGQCERAVPVFAEAVPALEAAGIVGSDPVAFADFLDTQAKCLRTSGRGPDGDVAATRAAELRAAHPGPARFTPLRYPQ